jgi:hypothetical protein
MSIHSVANDNESFLQANQLRVSKCPSNATAHYFLGLSYHIDRCRYQEAIYHYEKAIAL